MGVKLSKFRGKPEKSDGGAWVKAPDGGIFDGMAFKVRGLSTVSARKRRLELSSDIEVRKRRINGMLHPEDEDRINATILVECVLLDWSGLEDDDGGEVAYSPEKARELLLDPAYRSLGDAVSAMASAVEEIGVDSLEADKGN